MKTISFTVEGKPLAQKRHRDAMVTKNGIVKAWKYDPSSKDKEFIRLSVLDKLPKELPISCPVFLECHAVFPVPQSWTRKKRENMYGRMHTVKPDSDNIEKILMDALTGTIWVDDSQICSKKFTKVWETPTSRPRLDVTIKYEEEE